MHDRQDSAPVTTGPPRATILVAIASEATRDQIRQLLGEHWAVETAATAPDLVVCELAEAETAELVRALRGDPRTRDVPVIALGSGAGVDDSLAMPVAPRELVARVKLHLELSRHRADATTLQRIAASLSAELDLERLLQRITDEATRLVNAEFGAFFYNQVNATGESYLLYTLSGVPREAFAGFPMPRNTAIFAPTFAGEGVVRFHDVMRDERYGKSPPYHGMPPGHLPVRSYLAAPVISRTGEVLGGLFFGHSVAGVFDERAERLLVGVAAQGAIAIDNARLYDQVTALLGRERDARTAAELASRAKDEFLAILGHELRNPLAPIQTAIQLMGMRGDPATKERAVIERQVQHLVRLVDDLLDVSRITRGKIDLARRRVELAPIVAQAIEMASPLIEHRRHELVVDVPHEGLAIEVDPDRMAQVISNLLTNAAKYTPPGGHITIAAASVDGELALRVTDNGIGIPTDALERVFDPFVQDPQGLDRGRGGLGLGLAIVRNLVALHGGRATAHSAGPGQGSTFAIALPSAPLAAERAPSPVTIAAPPPRPDARRILVVDDNVDAAELIVEALNQLGHIAEAAFDGPSGLEAAQRLAPDVAVLDIGLPVMDGYELARRLRELPALAHTRLIALTGYGQERDRERSRAAGFDHHMVKPLRLDELERLLR